MGTPDREPAQPRAARRLPALAIAALLAAAAIGVGCGGDEEGAGEGAASEGTSASFGYGGDDGPARWGELDPSYRKCATGKRQSPIDLTDGRPAALPEIAFSYEPTELEIEDNGHSLEAEYPPGSSIELDGVEYRLAQFHYHAPSEHRIDGAAAPIEFHLVHESPGGERLVLGVMVERGQPNQAVAELLEAVPPSEGERRRVPAEVNALDLLPADPGTVGRWSYAGSLTTPPCDEGVRWHVFEDPVELSAEQIDAYTSVYEGTNRPLQPRNGRALRVTRG